MEVQTRDLFDIDVIYHMQMGPYGDSAPLAWSELGKLLKKNELTNNVKQVIGYGLDNPATTPESMLRYFACFELQSDFSKDQLLGIDTQTLTGGRYGVYRMTGDYSKMPENFGKLHNDWLPSSGEVADYSRPFLEIYVKSPQDDGLENALTDLCLPIREKINAR